MPALNHFTSEIGLRLAAAALLIPLTLLAAWAGGIAFLCLVGIGAALVTIEWTRLTAVHAPTRSAIWPLCAAIGGLIVFALAGAAVALLALPGLVVIAAAIGSAAGLRPVWCAAGIIYAGLPALALVITRSDSEFGLIAICWLLAVVWVGDSAAFAFGRLIGGVRLAPRISPAKTWSGATAAILGAVLVGLFTAQFVADTSVAGLVIASIGVGIAAVLGDLAESWIKRRFGAKNAGALIPGHGGMMDRVDSLIFAACAATALGASRAGLEQAGRGMLVW
ncbi:MAG: CDP-archaeol synthase [Rhizobiales bacterium]|nr:CDP-archaeol synthase [Hyphomicrobiales bacterium]